MDDFHKSTHQLSQKDTDPRDISNRTAESTGHSFSGDKHTKNVFAFIKHKIEKLSTAVYMVTSYMPQDEPVRSGMRVLALSSVGHSGHLSVRQVSTHFNDLEKDIEHMLSLVRLSRTLDMISTMNANILEDEYQKILTFVQKQKDNKKTDLTPITNTFDSHYYSADDSFNNPALSDSTKILERVISPIVDSLPKSQYHPEATNVVKQKKFSALVENKERRSVRQEQVLRALSVGEEMSIKDISNKVKGCSEKTIQRELNELLEKKRIKRIGEKRWSRYIKIS
jgi:hypothetical protein